MDDDGAWVVDDWFDNVAESSSRALSLCVSCFGVGCCDFSTRYLLEVPNHDDTARCDWFNVKMTTATTADDHDDVAAHDGDDDDRYVRWLAVVLAPFSGIWESMNPA